MSATSPPHVSHRHTDGEVGVPEHLSQAVRAYERQVSHGGRTEVLMEGAPELRGGEMHECGEFCEPPVAFGVCNEELRRVMRGPLGGPVTRSTPHLCLAGLHRLPKARGH